ncbi:hypothetical protein A4R35_23395 [Thermogemmatispora tikiterensis]|uniref:Uncharacterized protein n=1 Tax=Thermogemmatispora tikiterensis TaxID=1825093 RepID=A0A328VM54_9CHLR|nr:hypothetical protein A4R35_23395 [Thermogemmatispora tikiterensis]
MSQGSLTENSAPLTVTDEEAATVLSLSLTIRRWFKSLAGHSIEIVHLGSTALQQIRKGREGCIRSFQILMPGTHMLTKWLAHLSSKLRGWLENLLMQLNEVSLPGSVQVLLLCSSSTLKPLRRVENSIFYSTLIKI